LKRNPTSTYFSHSIDTSEARDPPCWTPETTSSLEASPTISPIHTTPIAGIVSEPWERPILTTTRSSEYIDRYHPTTPEIKSERYVAKDPELILKKIRRQKMAEAAEDNKTAGLEIPKMGDGADRRREDLNKELRNLFREE
jgi:hypothetical protein